MQIENEKEGARQAGRSATCRAWGAARSSETRGGERGKRKGPERQATHAGSGTRGQGERREVRSRGELSLAGEQRARRPLSFGGLHCRRAVDVGAKLMPRDSDCLFHVQYAVGGDLPPLRDGLRRHATNRSGKRARPSGYFFCFLTSFLHAGIESISYILMQASLSMKGRLS